MTNLTKRKYHYVQHPTQYEMQCDKCNGLNIWWSEYEGHIWCYDCEVDTPGTGGIFDGPIPINAMHLLGLTLDRLNLETGKIERFGQDENRRAVWKEDEESCDNDD